MTTSLQDSGSNALYHVSRHPVRLVAERTGLTPHTLRAWERRYQVVTPSRSAGGQRLYSDRDIEHLRLLHLATEAGRSIGRLSSLSIPALRDLVEADRSARAAAEPPAPGRPDGRPDLDAAIEAVEALDGPSLEATLRRAAMTLSVPVLLEQVVAPLLHEIGERWEAGGLAPAYEHLATTVIRTTLADLIENAGAGPDAPVLLVATPAGQRHELGAMLVATAAAAFGWRIVYLGPELPASDIVLAARRTAAAMIALSVVYPGADDALVEEVRQVREALARTPVIVGGRGVGSKAAELASTGATVATSLPALRRILQQHAG